MPQRLKVLLGVVVSLVAVWGGWYALHVRHERQREARLQEMIARAAENNQLDAKVPSVVKPSASVPAAKIVSGRRAVVELVRLVWKPATGEGRVLSSIDGCIPIAPDADVVGAGNELFLMKEAGRIPKKLHATASSPEEGTISLAKPR